MRPWEQHLAWNPRQVQVFLADEEVSAVSASEQIAASFPSSFILDLSSPVTRSMATSAQPQIIPIAHATSHDSIPNQCSKRRRMRFLPCGPSNPTNSHLGGQRRAKTHKYFALHTLCAFGLYLRTKHPLLHLDSNHFGCYHIYELDNLKEKAISIFERGFWAFSISIMTA
jgi:hypothetical protein